MKKISIVILPKTVNYAPTCLQQKVNGKRAFVSWKILVNSFRAANQSEREISGNPVFYSFKLQFKLSTAYNGR